VGRLHLEGIDLPIAVLRQQRVPVEVVWAPWDQRRDQGYGAKLSLDTYVLRQVLVIMTDMMRGDEQLRHSRGSRS
jgi:hypothetical protein